MTIPLWPDRTLEAEGPNAGCPSLTPYRLEGAGPHPVMIVLPGGGYVARADHEGGPVARWLNSIGVAAVVLNYRVAPFQHPAPLDDAQRAIRLVRNQAQAWNLDPNRVGVLGFSAGGHLASTAGTHYDAGDAGADDPMARLSSRPDLLVLCYPVITMGPYAHAGSRTALLGDRQEDPELIARLSNELQVTAETPPTFLWHTADDAAVPVENSLNFAAALRRHGVPFALHVFAHGTHGLGLAPRYPGVEAWTTLCEAWLKGQGFIGTLSQFSEYSTLGELRGDPRALAVLQKHIPEVLVAPGIELANDLPLRVLAGYAKTPEEQLLALGAELEAIS